MRDVNVRTVRARDELPPIFQADGEWFSTRVLEQQHRGMKAAIRMISPWLSASITKDSCKEYIDACNEIFKIDQNNW